MSLVSTTYPQEFTMKAPHFSFFCIVLLHIIILLHPAKVSGGVGEIHRRILHQPLYPVSSAPPPATESSPPPPVDIPDPDQPFFPEVPGGQTVDQNQPPPAPANGTIPIAAAAQPTKPTKKVAIAVSVGIVMLGMLSALAFFLYRHRANQPGETQSQKLVGGNSQGFTEESRGPPSSFLYIGTVEPSNRRSTNEGNGGNEANGSPYHKLVLDKPSNPRYRPSPELQPLPPLTKPPPIENSPSTVSSSDEESYETAFYTPQTSSVSNEDGYYTPAKQQGNSKNQSLVVQSKSGSHSASSVPHSKRTSPKSRLSSSSPDTKLSIIPSIKQAVVAPPPPLPKPPSPEIEESKSTFPYPQVRPKFSSPPPPPNLALLGSINNSSPQTAKVPRPGPPQPPPPPPPPLPLLSARKISPLKISTASTPSQTPIKPRSWTSSPKTISMSEKRKPVEEVDESASNLEKVEDTDDMDGSRPKLKPLHWDKVRATSDRATVWDQLKSSSFQLNEDMMETLFGCSTAKSVPKEPTRRLVFPPVEHDRVLDPKKSQNIAILLRAWNVTRDEVSDALLDGNPDGLGSELLESLVKMAPSKEEEIKLRNYSGDISKLGTAERFLKSVLDIPFAFKRVEAMLYRANFDAEISYLRKSFQTLETASEELKNSRLFLKLLEAVLRTGNRMNVGTNRGEARSFKLDTLLKLVDIKGTDGKTTLLHFVVQEIIRSEGAVTDENLQNTMQTQIKDDEFRKQGLQVVAGLSRDLINVKKAAGMDSDVLHSYVSKLEMGLGKVTSVLQYEKLDIQENFFPSMKLFLKEAEEEIINIKGDERKALSLVKEVTNYFHGDAVKEEAHPFRIFMIVRDFLSILDTVCKEVGRMHERTLVGSARSFRIASTASLPVLDRYNVRKDRSSDEESSSP